MLLRVKRKTARSQSHFPHRVVGCHPVDKARGRRAALRLSSGQARRVRQAKAARACCHIVHNFMFFVKPKSGPASKKTCDHKGRAKPPRPYAEACLRSFWPCIARFSEEFEFQRGYGLLSSDSGGQDVQHCKRAEVSRKDARLAKESVKRGNTRSRRFGDLLSPRRCLRYLGSGGLATHAQT